MEIQFSPVHTANQRQSNILVFKKIKIKSKRLLNKDKNKTKLKIKRFCR